jgi:diguanylate cyclase (GGDEF)-like protein
MRAVRVPIAAKFAVMLAVLVVAVLVVGVAGMRGLADLRGQSSDLYQNHTRLLVRTTALGSDVDSAARVALQIILANDQPTITGLENQLNSVIVPRFDANLQALRSAQVDNPAIEHAKLSQIARQWSRFVALQGPGTLDTVGVSPAAQRHDARVAVRVQATVSPITQQISSLVSLDVSQAADAAAKAQASYHRSRTQILLNGLIAIILGGAVVGFLVRAIVPRVRRYSDFATRVATGDAEERVAVTGNDELTDLGAALNEMVTRRREQRSHEVTQAEFAEVMQLTETEAEAHHLLKRQVERSIHGSVAVVLNRNNSADRLQATTPVAADSSLADTLTHAKPRSCLAVRFARMHAEQPAVEQLLGCEVCGNTQDFTTCEPLLVGGEVIGAVLSTHPEALSGPEALSIKESVSQAAPVLANLRNLAIAERRAKTDALTGLPNNRNVQDTVKRMVAQASRMVSPLAALALDLDHFKQINDSYGHPIGDAVLAAVGSTLQATVREGDFVGRAGGEEFLILLPNTTTDGAQQVAETIRAAVAAIAIPQVEQPITASLGIAVLPDHAGDGTALLRHADRALYAAKEKGRNRTETFTQGTPTSDRSSRPISPATELVDSSAPAPLAAA